MIKMMKTNKVRTKLIDFTDFEYSGFYPFFLILLEITHSRSSQSFVHGSRFSFRFLDISNWFSFSMMNVYCIWWLQIVLVRFQNHEAYLSLVSISCDVSCNENLLPLRAKKQDFWICDSYSAPKYALNFPQLYRFHLSIWNTTINIIPEQKIQFLFGRVELNRNDILI